MENTLFTAPEILIRLRDILLSTPINFEIFYNILKVAVFARHNINHIFHDKNDLSLGKTLLTISVILKFDNIVELLVDHGADVRENNGCKLDDILLYISLCYKKYNIDKFLTEPPIIIAIQNKSFKIIEILLKKAGKKNLFVTNMTNESALYLAIKIENVEIVQTILDITYNWNAYDSAFIERFPYSFHKSCFLKAIKIYNHKKKNNLNILKISKIIEILLEKKFDINITSRWYGVHIFDYFKRELDIELVSQLLEYGLRIPYKLNCIQSLFNQGLNLSSDTVTKIIEDIDKKKYYEEFIIGDEMIRSNGKFIIIK